MKKAFEAAQSAYETVKKTVQEKWEAFKNKFEGTKTEMAQEVTQAESPEDLIATGKKIQEQGEALKVEQENVEMEQAGEGGKTKEKEAAPAENKEAAEAAAREKAQIAKEAELQEAKDAENLAVVRAKLNGGTVENSATQEKLNITGVTKDRNFEGSIIVKTQDTEGRVTGYALRKNSSGEMEGNKIGYMEDGSTGPVYQLHEADFTKLGQQGVLESYEKALAEEALPEPEAMEFPVEKANITEVTKDRNFDGSIIVKTEDAEGRVTGYALRKNSNGDMEGNKIGYMKDGSTGPVYQLHEADFAKLAQSGVLESYENALAQEKEQEVEKAEAPIEKAHVTGVERNPQFRESLIVKTEGADGRIVGYALRRNDDGELEGNKIGYMNNGETGAVYQLHEADFAELEQNGVLEAYEKALSQEKNPEPKPEKMDFPVEKVKIREITKDRNFDGSIIIKTEGGDVYALRKNSNGEMEGNEINYMHDGSTGAVYQLHEADFAKLAQNGVLEAYEKALAEEALPEPEKMEFPVEKVKIKEVTKDRNFDGSIIIKTEGGGAYALRKNSEGEMEGNEINYMRDGSTGAVYQLHEADFAKLAQNGVLEAYEKALAAE